MKKNYFARNLNKSIIALSVIFCALFGTEAAAQSAVAANDTFIWNGTASTAWENPANWTILRGTTTAGNNTFPGEIGTIDVVFINKNDTPFAPILDAQVLDIARLNVANTSGTESGAVFTINAGAILNVGNVGTQSNNVLLNGGNIVNNGTLNIKALGIGFTSFPSYGINCGNPNVLPTVPREYGYSGSGTLTIDLPVANFAGAAAIVVLGNSGTTVTPTNNVNATYKFILNNPEITLNQATALGINVIRAGGGNNANKMIIAGTGLTLGTVGTPSVGALVSLGGGSSVTIETGTTLTLNSTSTNINNAVSGFSASAFATNFTNKGTINILGASARSGMFFSTGASATASVFNINNDGTINVNFNAAAGHAAFTIGNGGGGAANAGSVVNFTNTRTMNLKNTATAVGTGFSIFTVAAGEAPRLIINNSGTLNLEGSTYAYGLKTTLNNSSILNTNNELRSFSAINNNLGGSINFARTAATATTRQANFTILTDTDTSGALGSIYKDSNNNDYAIVAQKFSGGFSLLANVLSTATVPATGTLTRITGTGAAAIVYSAVGLAPINNAATGNVTNSGIINTDTASNLNVLSLLSTTATSVLSPGGDTGRGILTVPDFLPAAADLLALNGTLKIQASGNATAGVDFDTMQITGSLDVLDISGAILDVTGLYTPAALTTIDIITTNTTPTFEGAVIGSFASVVGLPSGWAVVYTGGLGGKVQLAFNPANLATAHNTFANFKFSVYPNPATSELNVAAAKNINKVEFFNLLGQKVQSNTVEASQKQLDISNLQKGIYLMEVTIDAAKKGYKIIKQ